MSARACRVLLVLTWSTLSLLPSVLWQHRSLGSTLACANLAWRSATNPLRQCRDVQPAARCATMQTPLIASIALRTLKMGSTVPDYSTLKHASKNQRSTGRRVSAELVKAGFSPDLASLLREAARKGDLHIAERWYRQGKVVGIHPSREVCLLLIDVAAKQGDLQLAEQWFERALQIDSVASAFKVRTLISLAAKKGELLIAQRWCERAAQLNVPIGSTAYHAVIESAAKAGKTHIAEHWFNQARAAGVKPNPETFELLHLSFYR